MIERSTFDDRADSAPLLRGDRSMRVLESAIATVALFSAVLLAFLPR